VSTSSFGRRCWTPTCRVVAQRSGLGEVLVRLDPQVQPIPVAAIELDADGSQHLPEAVESRWMPPPPLDQRARPSLELLRPESKLRVRRRLAEHRPNELAGERREAP
jgi:hypothetical protein